MDRRKRILNFTEERIDRLLAEYAEENGYWINVKMRLRDAVNLDELRRTKRENGLSHEDAAQIERDSLNVWKAHIDFVVVDTESHLPVLAAEC